MRFILVLLLFFTACNKDSTLISRKVVHLNIGRDPQTIDPRRAKVLTSFTLCRMLHEGLVRIAQDGRLENALARHIAVSDDGLQYRFTLRKSFWSNGEPLTAYDFVRSWKSVLDPKFPTEMAYQLYDIKNAKQARLGEISLNEVGIRAETEETLLVELEKPTPYFLDLLTMPTFFPVHADESVSNGPFTLKEWKHAESLTVVRNPAYWQACDTHLDEIAILMAEGADTELQMFESGKLDWAGSPLSAIPIDAMGSLKGSGKLRVSPFCGTYYFRINTESIPSKEVRKALSLALDRNEITEHILQGGQVPATHFVPPSMGLFPSEEVSVQRDKAKELLQGHAVGTLTLSYPNSVRHVAVAQAVQKQWASVGITVELEAIEAKSYFQRIARKEYQLAVADWTADFDDPINFLEVFKYANATHWENPKYVELLNKSAAAANRMELLREAEELLLEEAPIIPVYHFVLNYLQNDKLSGVALSPLGQIDFRWADLTAGVNTGSILLHNDTTIILTAVIQASDGSFLGQFNVQPGQQRNWTTNMMPSGYVKPGAPNISITPYTVVWQCPSEAIYSMCTNVSPGAYVKATVCEGIRYCTPRAKGQQASPSGKKPS